MAPSPHVHHTNRSKFRRVSRYKWDFLLLFGLMMATILPQIKLISQLPCFIHLPGRVVNIYVLHNALCDYEQGRVFLPASLTRQTLRTTHIYNVLYYPLCE